MSLSTSDFQTIYANADSTSRSKWLQDFSRLLNPEDRRKLTGLLVPETYAQDPVARLPSEVMVMVFEYLEPDNQCRLMSVSSRWRDFIQCSGLLDKAKEAYLAWTADEMGEPNTWSLTASIEERLQTRTNFKKAEATMYRDFEIPHNLGVMFKPAGFLRGLFVIYVQDPDALLVYDLYDTTRKTPTATLTCSPDDSFVRYELIDGYIWAQFSEAQNKFRLWSVKHDFINFLDVELPERSRCCGIYKNQAIFAALEATANFYVVQWDAATEAIGQQPGQTNTYRMDTIAMFPQEIGERTTCRHELRVDTAGVMHFFVVREDYQEPQLVHYSYRLGTGASTWKDRQLTIRESEPFQDRSYTIGVLTEVEIALFHQGRELNRIVSGYDSCSHINTVVMDLDLDKPKVTMSLLDFVPEDRSPIPWRHFPRLSYTIKADHTVYFQLQVKDSVTTSRLLTSGDWGAIYSFPKEHTDTDEDYLPVQAPIMDGSVMLDLLPGCSRDTLRAYYFCPMKEEKKSPMLGSSKFEFSSMQ